MVRDQGSAKSRFFFASNLSILLVRRIIYLPEKKGNFLRKGSHLASFFADVARHPQTWRFKATGTSVANASFMDSRLVVFIGQMNTSLKQLLADLPCQHMRLAFVRRGVAHEPVLVEQGRRGHRFEHLLLLAKGKGG